MFPKIRTPSSVAGFGILYLVFGHVVARRVASAAPQLHSERVSDGADNSAFEALNFSFHLFKKHYYAYFGKAPNQA